MNDGELTSSVAVQPLEYANDQANPLIYFMRIFSIAALMTAFGHAAASINRASYSLQLPMFGSTSNYMLQAIVGILIFLGHWIAATFLAVGAIQHLTRRRGRRWLYRGAWVSVACSAVNLLLPMYFMIRIFGFGLGMEFRAIGYVGEVAAGAAVPVMLLILLSPRRRDEQLAGAFVS